MELSNNFGHFKKHYQYPLSSFWPIWKILIFHEMAADFRHTLKKLKLVSERNIIILFSFATYHVVACSLDSYHCGTLSQRSSSTRHNENCRYITITLSVLMVTTIFHLWMSRCTVCPYWWWFRAPVDYRYRRFSGRVPFVFSEQSIFHEQFSNWFGLHPSDIRFTFAMLKWHKNVHVL